MTCLQKMYSTVSICSIVQSDVFEESSFIHTAPLPLIRFHHEYPSTVGLFFPPSVRLVAPNYDDCQATRSCFRERVESGSVTTREQNPRITPAGPHFAR